MLIDEYPDLLPGPVARAVAAQAALLDTHLVHAGITLPMIHREEQVLLHGHCHQKALVGVQDTRQLLHQAPGTRVEVVDSGCCGMAGSFGYEHYDLSMKIGERVLLPAVRSQPHAQIIAPGFSCRQQIAHGTGRVAKHPVEMIAERL